MFRRGYAVTGMMTAVMPLMSSTVQKCSKPARREQKSTTASRISPKGVCVWGGGCFWGTISINIASTADK